MSSNSYYLETSVRVTWVTCYGATMHSFFLYTVAAFELSHPSFTPLPTALPCRPHHTADDSAVSTTAEPWAAVARGGLRPPAKGGLFCVCVRRL